METREDAIEMKREFGIGTRMLANVCHKCRICNRAERKPASTFARIMRWHRTWCPAWAAHTRVYGPKDLS